MKINQIDTLNTNLRPSNGQLSFRSKLICPTVTHSALPFKNIGLAIASANIALLGLTNSQEDDFLFTTKDFNKYFGSVLNSYPQINRLDFFKFVKTADYEKLISLNPVFKKYKKNDWCDFFITHYQLGTKEFNENSLKIPVNLTSLLSKKSLNGYTNMFLNAFPCSDRKVGDLPIDWIKGVKTENVGFVRENVYKEIEFFRNKMSKHDILTDTQKKFVLAEFELNLSKILNKNVEIENLGSGFYKTAYKINVDGAKPVVLAIYHSCRKTYARDHGQWAEIPRALFLNRHPDKFSHFYFGKVPQNHIPDGFLVTEFLEDSTKEDSKGAVVARSGCYEFEDEEYEYECVDVDTDENIKNGKIYDYGGIYIYSKNRTTLDIKELFSDII